jgi:predicted subunit of tRNA(5-methylaminomethyl-2-thiouridylate) methyltransferase
MKDDQGIFQKDEILDRQKQHKDIEKVIERGQKMYQKELNDYLTYIHNLYNNLIINLHTKKEEFLQLQCLEDLMRTENEESQRLVQEADNEIFELKSELRIMKKNLNIKNTKEIFPNDIIDYIFKKMVSENLAEHPNFNSYADSENTESFTCLKTSGGKYLKKLCAIVYFIEKMRQRYKDVNLSDKEIKLLKKKVDIEEKKMFDNHVKVTFYNEGKLEYFLISMDSPEKQSKYTFKHLKEESCAYWFLLC